MKKLPLVLIPGFATNSELLAGFIAFLQPYFEVYCIDLPGFHASTKPLHDISIKAYQHYVEAEIAALQLDQYVLGAASFGFLISNHIVAHDNCIGMIAFFPYMSGQFLTVDSKRKRRLLVVAQLIARLRLHTLIWKVDRLFHRLMLVVYSSQQQALFAHFREHLDPATLFRLGIILLQHTQVCLPYKKPYALIMNPTDELISHQHVTKTLAEHAADFLEVHTTAVHFPIRWDVDYFREHAAHSDMESIADFFQRYAL